MSKPNKNTNFMSNESLFYRILQNKERYKELQKKYKDEGKDETVWIDEIEHTDKAYNLVVSLYEKFCAGEIKFNKNGYCYNLQGEHYVKEDDMTKEQFSKYAFARTLDLFLGKSMGNFPQDYEGMIVYTNSYLQCKLCASRMAMFCNKEMTEITIGTIDYVENKTSRFGLEKKLSMEKCPFDIDNLDYEVEIDVPSGTIVFMNDIREAINPENEKYEERYSPCYISGRVNTAKLFESVNTVYLQIGNCACDIAKIDDSNLVVGDNYAYTDEDGESEPFKDKGLEMVGEVCTDLWAYCATDKEQFLKACEEKGVKPEDFDPVYVEVSKGRYKFKHQYENCSERKSNVYTFISKVN